jgi:hypothetical protein
MVLYSPYHAVIRVLILVSKTKNHQETSPKSQYRTFLHSGCYLLYRHRSPSSSRGTTHSCFPLRCLSCDTGSCLCSPFPTHQFRFGAHRGAATLSSLRCTCHTRTSRPSCSVPETTGLNLRNDFRPRDTRLPTQTSLLVDNILLQWF